jgi:hypothetical protein
MIQQLTTLRERSAVAVQMGAPCLLHVIRQYYLLAHSILADIRHQNQYA